MNNRTTALPDIPLWADGHARPQPVVNLNQDGTVSSFETNPEGEIKTSVVSPLGVLPVSQLTTLHDGKEINYPYTDITETVGTGTGTFVDNTYELSVGVGQYMIRQTRRFMPYYSGKPQKVELTFSKFAPQIGVIKRVGYFSSTTTPPYDTDYDGFWLGSSDGEIKIFAHRNGVPTIAGVPLSGWSGAGQVGSYSELATWDNFTVIEFNFLWLGGAYIELRMMTESGWVTAHANIPAGVLPSTFIKSPSQPVRYEIVSTTGTGELTYICNQVATSGSIDESGRSRGIDTTEVAINLTTIGTIYPVIAVRKKPTMRDSAVLLRLIGLFIASADEGNWSLRKQATILGGSFTWSDVNISASQQAIGDGVLTVDPLNPGIVIATQNINEGQAIPAEVLNRNFSAWLSGSIDGTPDEMVLCFEPATVNCNVRASIGLLEV